MRKQKRQSNRLRLYRSRMGFSPKFVARMLGHKDAEMVLRYERGLSTPPLKTALRLEILYRTPASTLYWPWYKRVREEMRAKEQRLLTSRQLSLFQQEED